MSKLKFISRPEQGDVEIRARRKDTGKFDTFGYCHPATVPLIKKDGIAAHIHLIKLPQ
jgi:hypothetical protein